MESFQDEYIRKTRGLIDISLENLKTDRLINQITFKRYFEKFVSVMMFSCYPYEVILKTKLKL